MTRGSVTVESLDAALRGPEDAERFDPGGATAGGTRIGGT